MACRDRDHAHRERRIEASLAQKLGGSTFRNCRATPLTEMVYFCKWPNISVSLVLFLQVELQKSLISVSRLTEMLATYRNN